MRSPDPEPPEAPGPEAPASDLPAPDGPARATFTDRVVAVVVAIPPGTVATYGEVAVEAGDAVGASRAVGNVLQQVDGLPWWRVVTASGRLVPGLEARHEELLAAEGVVVVGGRVSMGHRRPTGSAGRRQHR